MNSILLKTVDGRVTFNGGTYVELSANQQIMFDQAITEAKGLPTSEQPPFNTFTPVVGVVDVFDPNFDLPLIDVPVGNFNNL